MARRSRDERLAPILAKNGIIPASMAERVVAMAEKEDIDPIQAVTDRTEVQRHAAGILQRAAIRAWEQDDMGNVVKAAGEWTRVVGARAPERHEVAAVVAEYENLPTPAKREWLKAKIAYLTSMLEALDDG